MPLAGSLVVRRATRAVRTANNQRRRALERELADYASEADCLDLDATVDRYPDGVTAEIRNILAHQRIWGRHGRPGATFPGLQGGR